MRLLRTQSLRCMENNWLTLALDSRFTHSLHKARQSPDGCCAPPRTRDFFSPLSPIHLSPRTRRRVVFCSITVLNRFFAAARRFAIEAAETGRGLCRHASLTRAIAREVVGRSPTKKTLRARGAAPHRTSFKCCPSTTFNLLKSRNRRQRRAIGEAAPPPRARQWRRRHSPPPPPPPLTTTPPSRALPPPHPPASQIKCVL